MGKPKREDKLEIFDYNFPEDKQYSEGNKNQKYYEQIKKYNEAKRKAKISRTIEKAIFWSFALAVVLITLLSMFFLKNFLEDTNPTFPQDDKIIVGSAGLSSLGNPQQAKETSEEVKQTSTTSVEPSTTTSTSEVQQIIPTVEQTSTTTSVLAQSNTTESSEISETTTIEEENESTEPSNAEVSQTKASETTTTTTQHSETTSKTTAKPTTEKPSETITEPTTSKQEYVYHVRFYIKSTKTNKVLGYYTSEMSEAEVSKVYKFANEQLAAESLDGETGTYYIVEEEYKVQK